MCAQTAIDKGWFRAARTTADARPQLSTILAVAADIAGALAYLHAAGVVHGDLAGGNVLLQACLANPHGFCAKVRACGTRMRNCVQDTGPLREAMSCCRPVPPARTASAPR